MLYGDGTADIISQYVAFTKIFDEQVKKYGYTEQAVRNVIRICKERDVLKKYLESRESEVVDIMITLFNDEEILDMYLKSEKRETAKEATREAAKEAIKIMVSEGKTLHEAVRYFPSLTIEDKKELEKEFVSTQNPSHMQKA